MNSKFYKVKKVMSATSAMSAQIHFGRFLNPVSQLRMAHLPSYILLLPSYYVSRAWPCVTLRIITIQILILTLG